MGIAPGIGGRVPVDTDGTLANNSDSYVPSQKAVKTYVDSSGGSHPVAVSQEAHGFSVGDVVRPDGSGWVKSQADIAANADVGGIVVAAADVDNFSYQPPAGRITGLSGLTAGAIHYLSPSVEGALTTTEPTGEGEIWMPVLLADSTSSGVFASRGLVLPAPATKEIIFKVLGGSTAISATDYSDAGLTVDDDMDGWSLTRIVSLVTTAPSGSAPAVTLKKNGTSMLSTNATIDTGEKTSDDATTPPAIKSDGTQTVASGDVLMPAGVSADSSSADRGFALKAVFTAP